MGNLTEHQFRFFVNHRLSLFTLFIWLSGLSWLGLLSFPEGNNSRREGEGSHRGRYRTEWKLQGKRMSPRLLVPAPFLSHQLDEADWVKLPVSLVGGMWLWTWREGGVRWLWREELPQDNMAAYFHWSQQTLCKHKLSAMRWATELGETQLGQT